MKTLLLASAATLLLSANAFAQTPAAEAPVAAPTAQASVSVSDEELMKFGKAADAAKKVTADMQARVDAAPDAAAKAQIQNGAGSQMANAVVDAGLTVKRYNEIATAMQSDRALFTRLYQLQNPQPADTGAQAGATAATPAAGGASSTR